MQKKPLSIITGGAGFIGSNLVAALEERNNTHIVVVDFLENSQKWHNLAKRSLHDLVHPNNILDFLNSHTSEIEVIFHLGAITSTVETNVDLIIETNFRLSKRLYEFATANKKRFIYASSAATYGDGLKGFEDTNEKENFSSLRPLNPYGWSKHLFDKWVLEQEKTPNQWVGLKFFNVYGPNEYHKGNQQSIVPIIFSQIQSKFKAHLFKSYNPDYKDGWQLRDFIYVKDCVDVMLWFFDNPKKNGIFNVGTGKARSFYDLADTVFKALHKETNIEFIDMPIGLHRQYQYFTQASTNRLKQAGYNNSFTTLEDGVKDYVQKFLMQTDPYL